MRLSPLLALLPLTLASPIAPLGQRNEGSLAQNIPYLALNAPSQGRAPEHGATGHLGAVASEVDVCSNVGADILAVGGSAADAIIAASLCVGVIGAFHSGLGGGGFALVRKRFDEYESYDFRETMPALGNATMYGDTNKSSTVGGLSVGVPGELRFWELLHAEHGRLPWALLFEPAIALARGGFKVPNQLALAIAQYSTGPNKFICETDIWKDRYCPNGVPLKEGDLATRPRYANTLATIAKDGPEAFYSGDIARRTVAAVQSRGGILTEQDLADYKVIKRTPGRVKYKNKTLYSTVAPSSGTVALSVLSTMGLYDDTNTAGFNLTTHRLIEATRYGYGIRTGLADPDFVSNVTAIEKQALSEEAALQRRQAISDTATFAASHYNPENRQVLSDNGTSQLTAVDAEGMAVTLTTTINLYWGSRIMTEDGIILNDEMDDFSIPGSVNAFGFAASSANYGAPGKRPLSSICPLIAEESNGQLSFATGSAGGSRIITAVIQNSYATLNGGNLQDAINAPRWHDQLGASTILEWQDTTSPTIPNWRGFSNATASYLRELGHNITYAGPGSSTAQGVQRFRNGTLLAAHENRQIHSGGSAI